MELVKAKVKGTQDVAVLEKFVGKNRVIYYGAGEMVFTADEVEEQGPYEGPYDEPQPQAEQKKYIGNAVEVNMSRVLCEALSERLSSVA